MIIRDLVFLDFETTGINPYTCQPIELAAVVIDTKRLIIKEDSLFKSLIKPIDNEEKCKNLNLDMMSEAVTKKTNITTDMLSSAPTIDLVWNQFQQYIKRYNPTGNKWTAPIKSGHNIISYDSIIIDRICGGHNRLAKKQLDYYSSIGKIDKKVRIDEPYGLGPWDDNRQEETLFAPRDCVDLMNIVWMWTENLPEIKSLSLDSIREWLGMNKEGSHRAEKDVYDGANILIKFLSFTRKIAHKTNFKKKSTE